MFPRRPRAANPNNAHHESATFLVTDFEIVKKHIVSTRTLVGTTMWSEKAMAPLFAHAQLPGYSLRVSMRSDVERENYHEPRAHGPEKKKKTKHGVDLSVTIVRDLADAPIMVVFTSTCVSRRKRYQASLHIALAKAQLTFCHVIPLS